jgi:hypothetical protein
MALQHLRSSTANKRPLPAGMSDGQLAINTNLASPGLFFKDSNGDLVKVGPVHVGTTAPNVSPASGGQTGNTLGEQWLDTSGSTYVFKIWDGSQWRSEAGEFVNASGDTMTGALVMDNQQQVRFRETTANGTNYIALQAPASVASDKTITLPDVTGTVVTTGDTGSVTSTMLLDGTIVNADVNASAAIAGTKISPDFGSQNVTTTGTATAAALIPSGSTVPSNGVYLPSSNNVAISTNGTGRLFIDSSGRILAGTSAPVASASGVQGALQHQDASSSLANANLGRWTADNGGYAVYFGKSRGTSIGSQSLVSDGDFLGAFFFEGSDGTQLRRAASITANVDGTPGSNDMPGRLVFGTTPSGSSSVLERMRITRGGLVGIGTASPNELLHVNGNAVVCGSPAVRYSAFTVAGSAGIQSAQPLLNLVNAAGSTRFGYIYHNGTGGNIDILNQENGGITFGTNNAERVRITSGGEVYIAGSTDQGAYNLQCNGTGVWGAGAYVNGSDERLKTNVQNLGQSLTVIKALRPVTFQYKEEYSKDQSIQPGFIAQELQQALSGQPYLEGIVQAGPEYLNVAYQGLIAVLVKAVQELEAKVAALEAA